MERAVLAGDIGGTKTYLALYAVDSQKQAHRLRLERYSSNDFSALADMVKQFVSTNAGVSPQQAVFAVAGPVVDQTSRVTNLPWELESASLARDLGMGVYLINDFQAVAYGLTELAPEDTFVLQDRPVDSNGPIAVLGAGTGLGEAILFREQVLASEGGHSDFAPRDEVEIELLRYLLRRHKRVSYERVLSGTGLVRLYEYFVEVASVPTDPALRDRMRLRDPAAVIVEAALNKEDEACELAVNRFASIYGAEAGNLALKVLPTGGLYVAGGIAKHILPVLQSGVFLQAFLTKGRMSPLLENMRVVVALNPQVGLFGARRLAISLLQ